MPNLGLGIGVEKLSRFDSSVIDESSFVMLWDTEAVTPGATEIDLPLRWDYGYNGGYNFTVHWGDGTKDEITSYADVAKTHTYANPGEYVVVINGNIGYFRFGNNAYAPLLREIYQWGSYYWSNISSGGNQHFYGCSNLTISATDQPQNILNLESAFINCKALTTGVGHWDVSNCVSFFQTFYNCDLFDENLNSWDTSSATSMRAMFYFCPVFTNGGASTLDFDTSSCTNMQDMFYRCYLFNCDVSGFDMSNVTTTQRMFNEASSFNNNGSSDIQNWTFTSALTNMATMFACISFGPGSFNQPINNWQIPSSVTNLRQLFYNQQNFNQDLDLWDTSGVTDMLQVFALCTNFNGNIDNWDVSNVLNIEQCFSSATNFNRNIGSWRLSSCTNVYRMFINAYAFNNGGSDTIKDWDVGLVESFISMFQGARAFNQPMTNWDVSSGTNFSHIFFDARALDQSFATWDVSNATNLTNFHFTVTGGVGLSTANYDATLIAWNSLPSLPSSQIVWFKDAQYTAGSAAETARNNIISTYSWTLNDGGPV